MINVESTSNLTSPRVTLTLVAFRSLAGIPIGRDSNVGRVEETLDTLIERSSSGGQAKCRMYLLCSNMTTDMSVTLRKRDRATSVSLKIRVTRWNIAQEDIIQADEVKANIEPAGSLVQLLVDRLEGFLKLAEIIAEVWTDPR